MELSIIKQLLNANNGQHIYKIYIPSLKKEMSFKLMNTGQIKSISKLAMDESTLEFKLSQLGIIQELCLDESFNIEKITDVDFISILTGLRINNVLEDLKLTVTCGVCEEKFNNTVNMGNIIKKCIEYVPKHFTLEKEVNGIKFKIEYGDAFYANHINVENVMNSVTVNENIDDNEKVKTNFTIYPMQFIKEIYINNTNIEFNKLNMEEMLDVIDEFPPYVLFGEDGLLKTVTKNIEKDKIDNFFEKIECPKCKNLIMGGLDDFENFFTL